MVDKIEKTIMLNDLYLEWVNNENDISEENVYTSSYIYPENNIYPYTIKTKTNEIIGYVFLEKTDDNTLYVQFLEILDSYKNEGYGTLVVKSLFDWFNVLYLEGMILDDGYLGAYYFWLNMNSTIECSYDEFNKPDFENDVFFYLTKENALSN